MAKKKPTKKIFESIKIESAEAKAESEEPEKVRFDETLSNSSPQEPAAQTPDSEERAAEKEPISLVTDSPVSEEPVSVEVDGSADDLMNDVRQSLIEDEAVKEEKKSKKWWRRVAKGLDKDKKNEAETPVDEETSLTPLATQTDVTRENEEIEQEYVEEIDELINMLETEREEPAAPTIAPAEAPPEVEVDIEDLKKQAFQPRSGEEEHESITEVRSVALEDGEEVFVEVESKPQNPLDERLTAFENALRPYQRYIYIAFTVLGVLLAVIASAILFNVYRQSRPAAPTVVSNLPFPTAISLPGGLNFSLGKGSLANGQWNPQGPEWLQGTEVCRWVAIPWSTQLEAVIRTLNADDPIELTMSNNDRLTYKVYSIQQLTNAEMRDLPSDSPCLLLVLAKADTETRWVLTALP